MFFLEIYTREICHYNVFPRDIHKRTFSLEDVDEEQSQLVNKLKDTDKDKKPAEKISFLKNAGLFISARGNTFNNFKSKIFPKKSSDEILKSELMAFDRPKPTKAKTNKSPLK